MNLPINQGPDFTPPQWTAVLAGWFGSVALCRLLAALGYDPGKYWGAVLVGLGFCAPPAVVGWLDSRRRLKGGER